MVLWDSFVNNQKGPALSLPTFQAALGNLRRTGEMLPPYTCPELDVTYEHPRKGSLPIAIDDRVLPAVGTLYTNNRALGEAVRSKFDHQTRTLAHAQAILLDALQVSAPVWGFAGYTGTSIGYDTEAAGIGKFYRHLGQLKYKPKLIVDGGVSTGVLGLSSIFAKSLHIPTLGFIPFKGLSNIGPRTHMVVCGATYPDRQVAVAAASDILVCWGGKEGTIAECCMAIENGSCVILPIFRKYEQGSLPNQYLQIPLLRGAVTSGQLLVCTSPEDLRDCIEDALKYHARNKDASRGYRRLELRQFLTHN